MSPNVHRATNPAAALGECVRIGLSGRDIARATGTPLDAVRGWNAGRATPAAEEAERLAALASVAARMARIIEPQHIAAWLSTPNPLLDGDASLDRIASDDHRTVARLVSGLEDPGAS